MSRTTRGTGRHIVLNVFVLLALVAGLLAPAIALAQDGATDGQKGTEVTEAQPTTEAPPVTEVPPVATDPPAEPDPVTQEPLATDPPVVATDPPVVATEAPVDPGITDGPAAGPDEIPTATEESASSQPDAPAMSLMDTGSAPTITNFNASVECVTGTSLRVYGSVTLSGTSAWEGTARTMVHSVYLGPGGGSRFDSEGSSSSADPIDIEFDFSWSFEDEYTDTSTLFLTVETVRILWDWNTSERIDVHLVEPIFVGDCTGAPATEPSEPPVTPEPSDPSPLPTPPGETSDILKDDEAGWFQAISLDCYGRLTYAYDVPEDTEALGRLVGYFTHPVLGEPNLVSTSPQTGNAIFMPAGRGVDWVQLEWWTNWHITPDNNHSLILRFEAWVGWPAPAPVEAWVWELARHSATIAVNGCLGTSGEAPEWEAPDVPWLNDEVPTEVPTEEPTEVPTEEPEDLPAPTITSFTVDISNACDFLGGGNTVSGTLFLSNNPAAETDTARIEVYWEVPVVEWNPDGQTTWGTGHYGTSVFYWSDQEISVNGPWSFSMPAWDPVLGGPLFGLDRPDDAIALVFRAEAGNWPWHMTGPAPDSQTVRYSLADCGEPPVTEPPVTEPPVTEPPATEPPATETPDLDGMFQAISLDCYGRFTYRYDLSEPRYVRFDFWAERNHILDQHLDYLHPAGQGVATHQFENGDPGSYPELMGTIHWSSDHEPEWGGDDYGTEAYANGCLGIIGTPESTPDGQLVQVPMSLVICGDEACESEGYDADGFYATWVISTVEGSWQGAVSGQIVWGSIQTLTSPLPVGEWEICLLPRLDGPSGTSIELIPPDCEVITLQEGMGHGWIEFQIPYQPLDIIETPTEPPVTEPPQGHEMYEAISLDCYGRLTYRYNLGEPTIMQFELLSLRWDVLDQDLEYLHPAGSGIGTFQFENSQPGVFDVLTGSIHWTAVDPYGGPSTPYSSHAYASGCGGVTGTPESTPDAQLVQVPLKLTLCGDEACASGTDDLGGFIATWTISPVAGGEQLTASAQLQFGQADTFTPPLLVGEWNVCLVPRLDHPNGTSVEVVPPDCEIVTLREGAGHAWVMFFLSYQPFDIIETPTEPPVTEPPATEPPVTEPPVTEPPVTEPPVTEPPATDPPATEPPVTEPPVTEPPVTESPVTEPPVTEPPVADGAAVPMGLVLCGNDDCTPPHRTDADGFTATWEFSPVAEAQLMIRAFFQQADPETVAVSALIQNGMASATSPPLASGTWAACLQPVLTRADGATIRLFDAPQCDTVAITADGEVSAVQTALPASVAIAIEGGSAGPILTPPNAKAPTTGATNQAMGTTSGGSSAASSAQQATSGLPVTGVGPADPAGSALTALVLLTTATVLAGTSLLLRRRD